MRICHLADTHLGSGENMGRKTDSGLSERQEDIVRSFIEAIDRIIAIRPDLVIHAGDIFDTVRPMNRFVAIAAQQLHRLAEDAGIPTVIITGNHDAPNRAFMGAALDIFRHIDNLHIASQSRLEIFRIGDCAIYALPHCLTTDVLKGEVLKCIPDPTVRFNCLVMHGVAAGMPEFSMLDLGEQELPLDVMARFDYTALGHFHNHCQVGRRAWYSGSTERMTQAERNSAKGFVTVDLDPFKLVFNQVSTRAMLDVSIGDVKGKRGDQIANIIREAVLAQNPENKILRIRVTGIEEEALKTIPSDVLADLKAKSFSLDIKFEREERTDRQIHLGKSALGRLDVGFAEYVEIIDTSGFDLPRKKLGLDYLKDEE
jgi:DNA repair protein SbcD/Mre11